MLIRHIARNLCADRGIPLPAISKATMQILLNYDYPGNVRELESILEHGTDHLP